MNKLKSCIIRPTNLVLISEFFFFKYAVLELKIWIYWSKSNSWIVLNKNWKIYWFKQSFGGIGPEDRCSSWGLNLTCQILIFVYTEQNSSSHYGIGLRQFSLQCIFIKEQIIYLFISDLIQAFNMMLHLRYWF